MWRLEESEWVDILISIVALSIAFSYPSLVNLPFVFIGVASSFIPHELAHRAVAIEMGYRARYRLSPWSTFATIVLSMLTGGVVKFGATGAVEIRERVNREDMVQIALAGPLMNLVVAVFSTLLTPLAPLVLPLVALSNVCVGVSNLLSVPPLDGYHVYRYSPRIWAIVFSASIAVGVLVLVSHGLITISTLLSFLRW
ncbi:MAG: hypothetical protein QXT28_09455 [Thermofilaceae archaeon]